MRIATLVLGAMKPLWSFEMHATYSCSSGCERYGSWTWPFRSVVMEIGTEVTCGGRQ